MTAFRRRRLRQLHLRQKAPATPSQSSSPATRIASPCRQRYPPLPPLLWSIEINRSLSLSLAWVYFNIWTCFMS
ncbi:hypothetical protein RHGRI_000303 [Rhododendron griersonianum]|uniref:Uncharacterized protein n=1 Tax=Rhododendron griersonianum TaxID=479676 RepID=A0AAV6LGH0_9ERIC|nr:hypothetical protein RHGRI_000303 [Rhododendron griersonianum]